MYFSGLETDQVVKLSKNFILIHLKSIIGVLNFLAERIVTIISILFSYSYFISNSHLKAVVAELKSSFIECLLFQKVPEETINLTSLIDFP